MNYIIKPLPIIFGILIFTIFSGFQFETMNVQTADAVSDKKIVGYFPFWYHEQIDLINYSELTNILYFHIWPNPDGSLNISEFNQGNLDTIRDRAHAAGVSVGISVGGAGTSDGFLSLAVDNTARANFVSNISNFVVINNLDGVDINWETEINQAKIDNQDILLSELTASLHPLGKTVSTTANGAIIDLKANNSIDWVHVMAYDMGNLVAEHSTFADSVAALQMYESVGFSKEKLVLGVPFYARSNGWTSAMDYEQVVSVCNPFAWQNYCNAHFFNGIDLVQQKARYVLDNDYHGVMVWDLGKDAVGEKSLLSSIKETYDIYPNLPCVIPVSGTWIITSSCTVTSNQLTPGNILVKNNSVLTVANGKALSVPSGFNITIESGGGILISSGGAVIIIE